MNDHCEGGGGLGMGIGGGRGGGISRGSNPILGGGPLGGSHCPLFPNPIIPKGGLGGPRFPGPMGPGGGKIGPSPDMGGGTGIGSWLLGCPPSPSEFEVGIDEGGRGGISLGSKPIPRGGGPLGGPQGPLFPNPIMPNGGLGGGPRFPIGPLGGGKIGDSLDIGGGTGGGS